MYVCVCKAIKAKDLTDLIDSGAKTVQEIGESCGAGTDCGCCVNRLKRMLATPAKADCPALCPEEIPTRKAV